MYTGPNLHLLWLDASVLGSLGLILIVLFPLQVVHRRALVEVLGLPAFQEPVEHNRSPSPRNEQLVHQRLLPGLIELLVHFVRSTVSKGMDLILRHGIPVDL